MKQPDQKIIIIDPTIRELKRAAENILMPDELDLVNNLLDRFDRDRASVDIANELMKTGFRGKKLASRTLKIMSLGVNNYTDPPTIHTVKTALHKTDYGKWCKKLH